MHHVRTDSSNSDPLMWGSLTLAQLFTPPSYLGKVSRVITLPSVKYNCPVETDVFESCDLGGARRVASQPVAKITIDTEPCMTMLLEKLRKSDRSLGDCCLCVQHMFKDRHDCCGCVER